MRYEDVMRDIEKLVGLRLNSIRPGAEITIRIVNQQDGRIELDTTSGIPKTRLLSEIQKIWEQLCEKPAVHVDMVLRGSGSSRNQPETILANLPYIEWFKLDNTKHIAFVGAPTHKLGTLKQMDPVQAEEIKQRLREDTAVAGVHTVVVVASDISQAYRNLESVTELAVKPVEPGIYEQEKDGRRILLVTSSLLPPGVEPGTYVVVKSNPVSIPSNSIAIQIAGQEFHVFQGGGMNLLLVATR